MRALQSLSTAASVLAFGLSSAALLADDMSGGGYHALRVDAGLVKGLGDGTYGQLGANPAGTPATIAGLGGVTDVAAGGFSTLALKSDGTVWFLGEATVQHTTPHGTPAPVSAPIAVAGLTGIDAIAAGHRHFLALDVDSGNLYAWGHNGSGQAGDGGLLDVSSPVVVLSGVAAMSAGDGFSMAVKTDHTLWSWGRNTHGQLGLGDTADRLSPTQVPGVTTAGAVSAGGQHALVLRTDGSVLATGNNRYGQLGLGTTSPTSTLVTVPGLSGISTVTAGYFHSATLGPGSQVSVWGRNFEGQCGGGSSSPVTYGSPRVLAGLSGTATGITCGYHFTLVGFSDGSVMGTGSNSDGQLDGSSVADQDDSQKVLAPLAVPLSPDITPPSPDPMTFASPPAAFDATTITMTATGATDLSGPVEYFFDCTTPGGTESGWQTNASYQDTGLTTGVEYTYQVKARDAALNETGLSAPASAIPMADNIAPDPNPMTFAVAPTAPGAGSITMTAATASDPNGVEYEFECTSGGGNNSGWQDRPTYLDAGLAPATPYTYRVRARDKSPNQNPTAFSGTASATTGVITVILAGDFTGRTVSGKTAGSIDWTVGGIMDPGDLTAVDESPTSGSFGGLFDTADSQGHFAPDKNVGNEGPWSVTIPMALTVARIQIDDVVLDWQHFNNSGDFQTAARSVDWTVSVTGSSSGMIGSVTASGVSGISGQETLAFTSPLTLTNAETYTMTVTAAGTDANGNNTGLDALTVNGSGGGDVPPPGISALIAHYPFDTARGGTTPDAVGANSATLGGGVAISTGIAGGIGTGVLEMTNTGSGFAPGGDGAVTSNSFSWTDDARTVTFWWKAKTPNVDTDNSACVSFGDSSANGTRFDIKESNAAGDNQLRVEVQGTGANSNPANFDDGNWHFVAVTVPDAATFADVSWFVDGNSTNLNTSTDTLPIITGAGPLVFGDSIVVGTGGDDRTPNGYLDEFQLYDKVLTQEQILFLYNNPGSVIAPPPNDFNTYITDPAFGLDPGEQGFALDPDGDGIPNGLEAWFGTHPGEAGAGVAGLTTDGTTTTFSHPRNETPPSDLSGFDEWSPNLADWYAGDGVDGPGGGPTVTISANPAGSTTTVTATASEAVDQLFLRVGVMQD